MFCLKGKKEKKAFSQGYDQDLRTRFGEPTRRKLQIYNLINTTVTSFMDSVWVVIFTAQLYQFELMYMLDMFLLHLSVYLFNEMSS